MTSQTRTRCILLSNQRIFASHSRLWWIPLDYISNLCGQKLTCWKESEVWNLDVLKWSGCTFTNQWIDTFSPLFTHLTVCKSFWWSRGFCTSSQTWPLLELLTLFNERDSGWSHQCYETRCFNLAFRGRLLRLFGISSQNASHPLFFAENRFLKVTCKVLSF